ncbi:MAG TPA: DUF2892 domain-containing protein [Rhodocyclaceae bacterium]|nr:DUF2892 domain-containing protein [Rhodocyclaceae bacterium]
MQINVGNTDRIIRGVVGLALIVATLTGAIGVWGWIGIVPLATAIFRFCPAYTLFGMNTCPVTKAEHGK